MFQIPVEAFSLSNEAVAVACGDRLSYANRSAAELLGKGCVGKSVRELFGEAIANSQAYFFTAELSIDSKSYTACVSRYEQYQVLFIHREPSPADYIGERFWLSMRDGLMNLGMSLELWREHASRLDDPQLKKSTAAMTHSYYKMSRLVTNVSHILNHDSCRALPMPSVFDLGALCRELIDVMEHLFPAVDFTLNCDENVSVCADRSMVSTAMLNLLSNALLHGKGLSYVGLSLTQSRDSVYISVSDDGCGIEPQLMHSVFCRYKENEGLSSQGAGFGLAVVRNIARSFGGTLLLESRLGHGTTARLSLSRNLGSQLRSSGLEYSTGLRPVLIGLADCLPGETFEERYMD